MNYELHYSKGGHGGPYADLHSAIERAKALLIGSKSENRIDIREGVAGKLAKVIVKLPPNDRLITYSSKYSK